MIWEWKEEQAKRTCLSWERENWDFDQSTASVVRLVGWWGEEQISKSTKDILQLRTTEAATCVRRKVVNEKGYRFSLVRSRSWNGSKHFSSHSVGFFLSCVQHPTRLLPHSLLQSSFASSNFWTSFLILHPMLYLAHTCIHTYRQTYIFSYSGFGITRIHKNSNKNSLSSTQ